MGNKAVKISENEGICCITLNRPEAGNALTKGMMEELRQVLRDIDRNEKVRVVILTGSGKIFQAGADIAEMSTMTPMDYFKWNKSIIGVDADLESLRQPVIAAINGAAVGGGLGLALACTLRVMAETAVLSVPEVKLGVCAGSGLVQRLSRLIGKGRAAYLVLTGERVTSQEALRLGLVNQVVPDGEVLQAAEEIARRIMANGQIAVEMTKDALEFGEDLPAVWAARTAGKNCSICFSTEEMAEGMNAYLQRRTPKFGGK